MEDRGRPMDTECERRYQGAQMRLVWGGGWESDYTITRAWPRSPPGPLSCWPQRGVNNFKDIDARFPLSDGSATRVRLQDNECWAAMTESALAPRSVSREK